MATTIIISKTITIFALITKDYRKLMPKIRTLVLKFDNNLLFSEIPKFRGAVIASLEQKDILYHNHDENGVIYKYPRIQYKRLQQKAAIICIKEGVEAIHELFTSGNFTYHIGGREEEMHILSVNTYDTGLDFCDNMKSYRLHNWLPLNSDNYKEYQSLERLADKVTFLEKKLVGNLLSFFTSIGFRANEQIKLNITNILDQRLAKYKNVKLMAFDVEFKANLNLPSYIGIGKSASIGFGTLTRIKNNKQLYL